MLDMPLNSVPVTTDRASFQKKLAAMQAAAPVIDVGFIGGVVPGNAADLASLVSTGVVALKSFMVDSQSEDFPHVTESDLKTAVAQLHAFANGNPSARLIPYILHAELEKENPSNASRPEEYDHKSYVDYERSRPSSWETAAVDLAVRVANNSRVHVHIAHVSSHDVVAYVRQLRRSGGLKVATLTTETCPHYLLWASEEIPRGGTLFKCSPPIRSVENRRQMLSATFLTAEMGDGIDLIASDHSPCHPDLKSPTGNLTESWGGVAGLQYRLQGAWTAASRVTNDIARTIRLLSEAPAKTFGLDKLKGFLKAGYDADMVIWDPDMEEDLKIENCLHRHSGSPFHDMKARGVVFYTLLRGVPVFTRGRPREAGGDPSITGQLLVRSREDGEVHRIDPKQWMAWQGNGLL